MNLDKQLKFNIQEETEQYLAGIRLVHRLAFHADGEAEVVDRLRENCPVFISLVAKIGEKVLGHVLFTPARLIKNQGWSIEGLGLGPLAVLPEYQKLGIGTGLCVEGLTRAALAGYPFVVVIGDSAYYPRFGFKKASTFGIRCAYEDVPDEAFMIKILKPKRMTDVEGVVYYRQEFDSVS
ncbi:MAG TPA: N-acetyltransferase [Anaerolineaceae bacterium]|nr:MAG: Acetyltransferase [Anaerolineaceae bacterium 46_22]HAF48383.1 N-acetyltransferase [Anaerolineaceae bacterium]